MVGQLRIYTINKGMMESWLKLFNEELISKIIEAGMELQSAWVNEENTQFIHIRTFNNNARRISYPKRGISPTLFKYFIIII